MPLLDRFISTLEKQAPTLHKIVSQVLSKKDAIDHVISSFQSQYNSVFKKIINSAKLNGYEYNQIEPYLSVLLGTDKKYASKILSDVQETSGLSKFMRDLSTKIANQADNKINSFNIPEIEFLVKEKYPFLHNNGMWENLKSIRDLLDRYHKVHNEIAYQYGLPHLGYRPNYLLHQYPFVYDLLGVDASDIVKFKEVRKFDSISDIKKFLNNWSEEYVKLKAEGKVADKYIIQPKLDISADWQTILEPKAVKRVREILENPDNSIRVDIALEALKRDPTGELFPLKLNEIANELGLHNLMRSYFSKMRVKLNYGLLDKYLPSKRNLSNVELKKIADDLGITPQQYLNEIVRNPLTEQFRQMYRDSLFPPREDVMRNAFRAISKVIKGDERYGDIVFQNLMPILTKYPVFKYLAFNFSNSIANLVGFHVSAIPYMKNLTNLIKAEQFVIDKIYSNPKIISELIKIADGSRLSEVNPLLLELSSLLGNERFTGELLQAGIFNVTSSKIIPQVFDKAVNASLKLSLFSHIETHNRLASYIAKLLEEGVPESDILDILSNRLKTTDRLKLIGSELYNKHLQAIDFVKKVNYIQDPFYNTTLENWVRKTFGSVGNMMMILRHYPLTGIGAMLELIKQDPKLFVKNIVPLAIYTSLTTGLTSVPIVGAIATLSEIIHNYGGINLSNKFNDVVKNTFGEGFNDMINYGLIGGNVLGVDLSHKVKFVDNILYDIVRTRGEASLLETAGGFIFGVPYAMVNSSLARTHTSLADISNYLSTLNIKPVLEKVPTLLYYLITPTALINLIDGYHFYQLPENERFKTISGTLTPIPYKWTKEDIIKLMALNVNPIEYTKTLNKYLDNVRQQAITHKQISNLFRRLDETMQKNKGFHSIISKMVDPATSDLLIPIYAKQARNTLISTYHSTSPQVLEYKEKLQQAFKEYQGFKKNASINDFINAYMVHIGSKIRTIQLMTEEEEEE